MSIILITRCGCSQTLCVVEETRRVVIPIGKGPVPFNTREHAMPSHEETRIFQITTERDTTGNHIFREI